MAKKIKVNRDFIFKAYELEPGTTIDSIDKAKHSGTFMTKSECHYYVEKHVLDFINNNANECENKIFTIFNVSNIEDSDREDYFIESIEYKDGEIKIRI